MRVEGTVREAQLFGENVLLRRSIETRLGESTIRISDTVTNEGVDTTPLMMLYHFNLGWPLVDEGTTLLVNAQGMRPRDADAAAGIGAVQQCSHPEHGYREQLFYYDLHVDDEGYGTALLLNKRLALGFSLRIRQAELPRFIWLKNMVEGMYMVGMEPANCHVEGRGKERERGTLQFLDPGESRSYSLLAGILEGETEIGRFVKQHGLQ